MDSSEIEKKEEIESHVDKVKKKAMKRTMTPEMLEKLKVARLRASEVVKKNAEIRRIQNEKEAELKLLKKIKDERDTKTIKAELLKNEAPSLPRSPPVPLKREENKINLFESDSEDEAREKPKYKKNKPQKKKKIVYKYESDSSESSVEEIIIRRKPKKEGSPSAVSKPIDIPKETIQEKKNDIVKTYMDNERIRLIRCLIPTYTE